jgi:hypothetical protein
MKDVRKGTFAIGCFVVAVVLGLAAPAFAQEPAATPPVESAPPPAAHHHAGGAPAAGGLGIGAAAFVSGLAGPEVVYDFGIWHLAGMLAFDHRQANGPGPNPPDVNTFLFSASGWFHLHAGDSSDFSLGGGFGLINQSVTNGGPNNTAFEFEPGVQVRVFVTQNVAVSARLGIVFAFGDSVDPLNRQIALDGQTLSGRASAVGLAGGLTGGFGFTYFFR